MTYISTATTTTIGKTYGIRIEINATLTGTVTVTDDGVTKAIIAIGQTGSKIYFGFTGVVGIITSAADNVTVSTLNRQG